MNLKNLDYSQLIGATGDIIGNMAPQQWTSNSERNVDTLMSTLNLGAKGAQIGTSIMPGIGTLVGGAAGAITGFVSKAFKNGKVEGLNFADASLIKEIKPGLFGKSRHGQYVNAVNNANNNLASVYNSMNAQQRYLEEYDTNTNILGRADGGIVPTHPIKLSKGEVYVDKDGNATRIGKARPNTKDDVLAFTTEGYVFSHAPKFKNKKTNETPADEAARMMNTKKITGDDRYAEGTRNALKLVFETLKNKLELLKALKESTNGIPAFGGGGEDKGPVRKKVQFTTFGNNGYMLNAKGIYEPIDHILRQKGKLPEYWYYDKDGKQVDKKTYDRLMKDAIKEGLVEFYDNPKFPKQFNPVTVDYSKMPEGGYGQKKVDNVFGNVELYNFELFDPYTFGHKGNTSTKAKSSTNTKKTVSNDTQQPITQQPVVGTPANAQVNAVTPAKLATGYTQKRAKQPTQPITQQPVVGTPATTSIDFSKKTNLPTWSDEIQAPNFASINSNLSTLPTPDLSKYAQQLTGRRSDSSNKGRGIDWGGIATDITSLAPIISNLFVDKPDTVQPVNNPYESLVASTMRNRRYNARPELDAIDLNRRITNYNMRNLNTNTGAGMAYALLSAVNADRAMSSVRAQENNMNNAYAAEYANTMNSLGQQRVSATNMANEMNAQNLAAYNDIRRNALNGISSWAQNKQLMRNWRNRDNAMFALYEPFLQYGFTNNTVNEFKRWSRKGGNYVG